MFTEASLIAKPEAGGPTVIARERTHLGASVCGTGHSDQGVHVIPR